ncbi:putative GP46 protein [Yersinia kristensenii]|uniref:Putative GP46 protein n=2 Tax=Yersinia kristensenii TaxID=28152 RepID=A0A0T9L9R2_YERKR|nr:putative GP46 protein [Yersinia kristensenii]
MRQAAGGIVKFELKLDSQEVDMLRQNCALRRPQRDPYDMDEYITMLIRKDNAELQAQLKEQAGRKCDKCGDILPGDPKGCLLIGDSDCWQHAGWHETKLTV